MPIFLTQPFLMQLPLAQAGQLLLVMGISFVVITLICSTYRFHKMIQFSEDELLTVQDCDDFFYIQVTRYLSKINRTSSGFGILIIQFYTDNPNSREVQEQFLAQVNTIIRKERDKACLFHDDCIGVIIDTEEEKITTAVTRLINTLSKARATLPITALRASACGFPANGNSSKELIDCATTTLEKANVEMTPPLQIAAAEEEEDTKEIPEEALVKHEKSSTIDELTGVLKPKVVGSYMRKYLAELRQKKEPVSLLCVGINRIDNIISLQGEKAADAVIAQASQVIQKISRESDLIGRYHRDDFMVLAPCTLEQGEMIAIRLREAVQQEIFLFEGQRIKTSISVGISAYPEHGRTLRDLFNGAFAALEIIREWETSSCLVFDPSKHSNKMRYDSKKT